MRRNLIALTYAFALTIAVSVVPVFASIAGSSLTPTTAYISGATNILAYDCYNAATDEEYMYTVAIQYISNMNVIAGLKAYGDKGALNYNGAVGEAALARWDSDESSGVGYGAMGNESHGYFTNEVIIDSSITGDVVLTYYLFGDGYAAAPHALTNTLILQEWVPNLSFTPEAYYSRKIKTSVTLFNDTASAGDFNLSYIKGVSNDWEISGPASISALAAGTSSTFPVQVLITNSYLGETQTSTVVAVSATDPSIIATATVISVSANNVVNIPVDLEIGSLRNLGVEYDGNYFWVTSSGGSSTNNLLSKLDADGNLIEQYYQATSSTWGWRDMAWDGTNLYASDSTDIDIIDPGNGTTNGAFTGPLNPNRALAYDPVKGHFWTANFASDIYEIDMAGNVITQFPNSYSIYGMAWDDKTPGGPFLLVWAGGNPPLCAQFDPVAGVYTGVSFLGAIPPSGLPGGACFAEFGGKDTFFAMHQADPDAIVGYTITKDTVPPTVATEAAYPITWDFAIFKGTVNPKDDLTKAYFEYGSDTSYGFNSRLLDLGYGSSDINIKETSQQLLPSSALHYRLVAYNIGGTNYGIDQVVNTPIAPVNMPAMWFQPLPGDSDYSAASQSATNYPFDARVADDFMYFSPTSYFSQIRWWAGEWPGVPPYISPYAFNIYLYTNYPGGAGCYPTNIIQTWTIPIADCHEELFNTNNLTYSYWAELSPAFMPQAGVHYWLSIQPALDTFPQIGLKLSGYDANLCTAMQLFPAAGISDWTSLSKNKDIAYVLYPIPEPAVLFALIVGLLLLKKRR